MTTEEFKAATEQPPSKLKRAAEEEEEEKEEDSSSYWTGSDSESVASKNDNFEEEEEIPVDFEFGNFEEIDYHGVKTLLKQVFAQDIQAVKDGDLADQIIKNNIGCTVKVDDNLDPFAIITCLQGDECVKPVFDLLLEKVSQDDAEIKKILSASTTGFLINDRLINMPPQIVPAMFKFLLDDVKESMKNVTHIVYISKTFSKLPPTSSKSKKKKQKVADAEQPASSSTVEYFQVEDEFIAPMALLHFDYALPKQQVSDSRRVFDDFGVVQSRRVFIIQMNRMEDIIPVLERNLV